MVSFWGGRVANNNSNNNKKIKKKLFCDFWSRPTSTVPGFSKGAENAALPKGGELLTETSWDVKEKAGLHPSPLEEI